MKSMLNSKQRGIICWFIIISIILFLLSGCSNTKQYEVKFNSNGGTEVESIMITKNDKIIEPPKPTRVGYIFKGWYYKQKKFDFNTKITKNITLKAKWKSDGTGLIFSTREVELSVDEEVKLTVKTLLKEIKKKDLIWSSSDNSIVSVNQEGKIKAKKVGTVIITVKTKDDRKASIKVTVKAKEIIDNGSDNYNVKSKSARKSSEKAILNSTTQSESTKAKQYVNTEELVKNAIDSLDTEWYQFKKIGKNKITVNMNNVKYFISQNLIKYYTDLFNRILNTKEVESIVLIYQKETGEDIKLVYTKNQNDIETWLKENSNNIFGKSYEEVINYDLINKKVRFKINLVSSVEQEESNPNEYEIEFTGEKIQIDTEEILKETLTKLDSSKYSASVKDNGLINVNIKNIKTPVSDGFADNLSKILSNIMANEDIESVDLIYLDNLKLTIKDNFGEIEEWLNKNSQTIFNKDYQEVLNYDLIGKKFNIKINLKYYASEKEGNQKQYELNFIGDKIEVDTDNLMNESMHQLDNNVYSPSTLESGSVTVNIKNIKTPVSDGFADNLSKILSNIMTNEDIESVDLIYLDNVKLTLKDNFGEIEEWLNKNSQTIFNKDYQEVLNYDLIGKKFNIKINLKYYASKKEGNQKQYELNFIGDKIEVDTNNLMNEAISLLDPELYKGSFVNNDEIIIDIKNIKTSIITGAGSRILMILDLLLDNEGVEGISFSYETETGEIITFEYTKNMGYNEMKTWLEENDISIFGVSYEKAINADIVGKNFKVAINLDKFSKKKVENPKEYEIKFTGEKLQIDTEEILKEALTKLDSSKYSASVIDNGLINVNIKNIKTPVSDGFADNLSKILSNIMANEDIESVDLIYLDNVKLTLKDNFKEIEEWLNKNSQTIFNKDYQEVLNYDLIGKKFNIKINLKYYASEKEGNQKQYEIIFDSNQISVNTDLLLKNSIEQINQELYTKTWLNDGILTITLKDVDTNIIDGLGAGLLKNLNELVNNEAIDSIDFKQVINNQILSINKDTNQKDINTWLTENSEQLFNKNYTNQNITCGDLVGREFQITINLYPMYKNTAKSFDYKVIFNPTEYNVTLDYNDSKTPNLVQKVNDGSKMTIPPIPEREGYKFVGWYEQNSIVEFDFSQRIKKNIQLVAHWVYVASKDDYTLDKLISEKNKFNTVFSGDTNTFNVTIIKPKESIDSIGLYDDIKRLLEKKEVTSIVLRYNSKDYTFKNANEIQDGINSFYSDISNNSDKSLKSFKDKSFSVKIVIDSDLVQFEEGTNIDIVYYIKLKVLQHNVTFNYNDGRENKTITVDNYDKIVAEIPERDGYRFDGWYQNSTKFNFSSEITNDITLTAHWIKQHKVTFDYGYNNNTEIKLVDDNSTITGKTLTREGYKFMGWYKDGEETPFDFKTPITENLKLTAHWSSTLSDAELKSLEKASAEALKTINSNAIINVEVDQTKNIITINHYDPEPGCNGGLDDGIMYILTGSKAHTALYNFLNNQYVDSIELYLDGMDSVKVTADMIKDYDSIVESASKFLQPFKDATGLDPISMTYKDLIDMKKEVRVKINLVDGKAFENEEDAVYTFKYTNIPSDAKVTNYTVTFDYSDGKNAPITKTIADGSTVTAPEVPQREGYKFAGWYEEKSILPFDFSTKIKKDTKLIAHWVLVTKEEDYILYYNVKENDIYSSYYSSINNAVKVTIIQPNSDISTIDLAKNIKQLVQKQEVKSVTMKYNNYEYTFYYNKSLDDNINGFLVNITEKDKVLSKQLKDLKEKEIQVTVSIDPNVTQLSTTSSTEIKYSINFKVLQQQVVLKYNNNQSNETIIVDNYSTIYEKIPKRTGYRFLGWYLEGTNTKFNFDTQITKATVLVARWIKQHTVTFNYGYNNMTETMLVDNNTTIAKSNPVRTGYKFLGWYKAGGQTPFDLKTPITDDITLTARWVRKYTVTFDLGYDNKTHVVDIDENSSLTPYSVNRAGYKFLGWYLNDNLYNFSSPIVGDIVLKAKWVEIVDLSKQTEAAIKTINGNNKMAIDVNQNTHIITIYWWKSKTQQAVFALAGSGARTALANFINDPSVENVELFLEGMDPVTVTYDMVESTQALDRNSEKFMKPFLDATGFDNIWRIFMIDLYNAMQTKNIKVKINLVEGKTFAKEEDAYYTFALVLDNPPETKTTFIKNNFDISLKGLNFN